MSSPAYQIGQPIYFAYVPKVIEDMVIETLPQIPATILSIAHSFDRDIQETPDRYFPRITTLDHKLPRCWWYYIEIDLDELAALGQPPPTSPKGMPLATDVVKESLIIGERLAF